MKNLLEMRELCGDIVRKYKVCMIHGGIMANPHPHNSYSDEQKLEFLRKLLKYVDETEIPIIQEYAYTNGINHHTVKGFRNRLDLVVKWSDSVTHNFDSALKKLADKQFAKLFRQSSEKGQNPASSIFLLKALHGLRDNDPVQAGNIEVNIDTKKLRKSKDGDLEAGMMELIDNTTKKKPKKAS